jgi:uncharacterized membrane protein YraQ (UPF0718 family)
VPKVLMLLALIVFAASVIQTFFTPEKTRAILAGKRQGVGNVLAASLGIVTPFCSCSAVPLFIGFLTAGVPLGVTFSFLVSAPMVNEAALALLFGMFGWKIAASWSNPGCSTFRRSATPRRDSAGTPASPRAGSMCATSC